MNDIKKETTDLKTKKGKKLIITESGVTTEGFDNIYEILGFIDLKCNPTYLKQLIMSSRNKSGE